MSAWPVIDGRVRVFKHDGGPIDEQYENIIAGETVAYVRKKDGNAYLFFRRYIGGHGFAVFKNEGTVDHLEGLIEGFVGGLRAADPRVVLMDPACYYMATGEKQRPA